jgi:hypothetical protein
MASPPHHVKKAKAYLSHMGLTVATECLSEHMTALKDFSYQLVTISWRLVAEVLGLGLLEQIQQQYPHLLEKPQN